MRASALGLTVLLSLLAVSRAEACSKTRFIAYRMPGAEALIAVSTTDTIRVAGNGRLPPAFGMLARVERLGARSPLRGSRTSTVVLVPWDYGGDCTPMPWKRGAAWVPAGTRGLYIGTLRDRSAWVGGVPTIDVHFPYPHGFPYTDARPSPEVLLAMHDRLPEPVRTLGDTARVIASLAPLFRWARENPDAAANEIVAAVLREARSAIAHARVEAIASPVAGTYRVVVGIHGRDSMTFFVASERTALSGLSGANRRDVTAYDAEKVPVDVGYVLYAEVGASASAALRASTSEREQRLREGMMAALIQPEVRSTDSTVWRGSMDVFASAATLYDAPSRRALLVALGSEYADGAASYVPGRFVVHRDGRTTYEASHALPGRAAVFVRGVRVSTRVLPTRR